MAVVVLSICLADVVFAMHMDSRCLSSSPSQSQPVVNLSLSSEILLIVSQTLSLLMLWLRPIYFLLASLASVVSGMQHMLAVVLILISAKIFVEAAGFEVPLTLFFGVLAAWRVLALVVGVVRGRRGRGPSG